MALIECPECKKQISDNAISCPNCGYQVQQRTDNAYEGEYLCCPKCHSKELHSEHQGFSGGKALAGAVLTGSIGMLTGTIGSKEVRITCLKCGHHFKAGEALIEKVGAAKKDMDDRILNVLIQEGLIQAVALCQKETNRALSPSMDYVREIARKNNIEIPQNKGCSVFSSICVIILCAILISIVGYLILNVY